MEKTIKIKLNGSVQKIVPSKEFKFSEETLLDDLTKATSYYGYLVTLKANLLRMKDSAYLAHKQEFAIQFSIVKEDDVNYSRTPSDQTAEAVVLEQKKYVRLLTAYREIQSSLEIIQDLMEGYKNKIEVMRTIAVSLRQQP